MKRLTQIALCLFALNMGSAFAETTVTCTGSVTFNGTTIEIEAETFVWDFQKPVGWSAGRTLFREQFFIDNNFYQPHFVMLGYTVRGQGGLTGDEAIPRVSINATVLESLFDDENAPLEEKKDILLGVAGSESVEVAIPGDLGVANITCR